jgi:hypothetical protein
MRPSRDVNAVECASELLEAGFLQRHATNIAPLVGEQIRNASLPISNGLVQFLHSYASATVSTSPSQEAMPFVPVEQMQHLVSRFLVESANRWGFCERLSRDLLSNDGGKQETTRLEVGSIVENNGDEMQIDGAESGSKRETIAKNPLACGALAMYLLLSREACASIAGRDLGACGSGWDTVLTSLPVLELMRAMETHSNPQHFEQFLPRVGSFGLDCLLFGRRH